MAKKQKEESVIEENEDVTELVEDILSDSILEEPINSEEVTEESTTPSITSVEWNDYVMGLFDAEELQDGSPKCDGLRRVAQLLLGNIVNTDTIVVSAASNDNNHRATVVVKITFDNNGRDITYSGAADSCYDNTDNIYRTYPTAIAETRAESRALRKALNLKTVVAEEVSKVSQLDVGDSSFSKIQGPQIKAIDVLCKRLNISVEKFINMGTKQYNNIKEIDYDVAIKMLEELNRYQVDSKNSDFKTPLEAITGYDASWNKGD